MPSSGRLITLHDLPLGKTAIVDSILAEGINRRRLMDLGLIPGTRVESLRISPTGDPTAFIIRGTIIAFRREESSKILVNYREV